MIKSISSNAKLVKRFKTKELRAQPQDKRTQDSEFPNYLSEGSG